MKNLVTRLICLLLLISAHVVSAQKTDRFWQAVDQNEVLLASRNRGADEMPLPKEFKAFRLDTAAMRAELSKAPLYNFAGRNPHSNCVITLPMPDGGMEEFEVYEDPVFAPELAAKYPEVKTYTGISIYNSSRIVTMDYTVHGVHYMIKDKNLFCFLEPVRTMKNEVYVVSNYNNFLNTNTGVCNYSGLYKGLLSDNKVVQSIPKGYVYELAVSCTDRYSKFHAIGGVPSKSASLSAINTSVSRIRNLFRSELRVSFFVVANNDAIIILNGNEYLTYFKEVPLNTIDKWVDDNQTLIDNKIGFDNYDIGHLFDKGGRDGYATGTTCAATKAKGFTSRPAPVGPRFDIDYVSHEIGHQFTATHPFASNECNGLTLESAVEVGSGTTIMGYAGLCGISNVETQSDPYFHSWNINQINDFLEGSDNACFTEYQEDNQTPQVNFAGNSTYYVPKSTPFKLFGTSTDAESNSLLYCWEQIDPGENIDGIPKTNQVDGPLFRSFLPENNNAIRYFPKMRSYLQNDLAKLKWEVLPSVDREMNFRLSVRDGNGRVGYKDMKLIVTSAAGPFRITSEPDSWLYGEKTFKVTWDKANTDLPLVNCDKVDLYLLNDLNLSLIPILLETPNDGEETIVIPNVKIPNARFFIQAANNKNVFYAVSSKDFYVTEAEESFKLSTSNTNLHITPGGTLNFSLSIESVSGFNGIVELSTGNLLPDFTCSFSNSAVNTGNTVSVSLTAPNGVPPGNIEFDILGKSELPSGTKLHNSIHFSINIGSYAFLDDKKITCIAQSKDGTIFAGTDEGIWRFTGVNFEQLIISGALINKYLITDMAADASGGIWVATRGRTGTSNPLTAAPAGRVFYFKNPAANPMTTGDYVEWGSQAGNGGLQSRYTTSIDIDGDKVWAAHYYQTKIDGSTFDLAGGMSVLNYANPTPQPLFTPVTTGLPAIPSGNSCYYRNCDALAARFDETWLVSRANETGCSTVVPNAIYHYKNGALQNSWLPDNLSDPAAKALLTDAYPRAAFTDRLKNTWIGFVNNTAGSSARGLLVFPPDASTPLALSDCYFPATASISRNAIWEDNVLPYVYVGTNIGLMIINSAEVESTSNYLFYNALESNQTIPIIRGGMVDKEGSLWLATDKGVIRTTLNYLRNTTGPTSLSSEPIRLDVVNHNLSYKLTSNNDGYPIASLKELKANLADTLFSVATDGTDTWFVVTGTNVQDVEVKIVGNPSDQDKFGFFEVLSATAGKKVFKYHHPTYLSNDLNSIGVEVRNPKSCAGALKYKFTVKFVAPPVLLLHGLWSEGEGCWKEMKEGLKDRGYPSFMVNAPSYPNNKPFVNNIPLIPVFVTNLLKQCALSKVSTSKADLVGHSMGGIMSRLYLQSPKYHNDIHKIITIDTPHSGSQGANVITGTPGIVQQILALTEMDPTQGAVADLRVNSTAIDNLLNGTRLNAHLVPSHSISSEKTVLEDIVDFDCTFPPALYLIPGVNEFLAELSLECMFAQFLLAAAPEGLTVDDFVRNTIYGGEPSDLVVAESSQKGGLTDAHSSGFYDLSHMEIQHNKSTVDWVYYLLRAKTNAEEFAQTGFMPKPLDPLIPSEIDDRDPMSGTVDVTQPAPGASYMAGTEVNIKATTTGDINKIIVTMGNANIPVQTKVVYSNSADVTFTIPISAIGRVNIVAAGYKNNLFVHLDTSWINVSTAANLDSLKIGDGYAVVPIDHNLPIQIKGYYDDGTVRDVTTQVGMQFNSQLGRVSFTAPNLKGLVVGADTLSFTLSGKTALLAVEVDSIDWIDPDSSTTSVQQPGRSVLKTSKLNAYPNPFNETITLQIPGNSVSFSADILIFNTLGQSVFTEKNIAVRGEQAFSCDLNRLPEGMYYVLLTTPQGSYSTKITKHGGR